MVTIGVYTVVARIRPVMQRTPNKNATFESTQARPSKTPQILLKSPSKPFKQTGALYCVGGKAGW
jgi:antitoxin (DNA-binding transcriptional repressor) of toxin-antitoxin stability system